MVGLISTIGFGSLWVNTVQKELVGLDTSDITVREGTVLSATNYVTIESIETRDDKKHLHFKVENTTSDILTFSTLEGITLAVDEKQIQPDGLFDRQQSKFTPKILSNTTVYGTLVFSSFDGEEGVLSFDNMYFETRPDATFKESLEINFELLKPVEELRS